MRVCIANHCGSVGKSTISKQLIAPRLPNTRRVSIESLNNGSDANAEVKEFFDFETIQQDMVFMDEDSHLVIDVGQSEIRGVLDEMVRLSGAQHDIDFWVVPCPSDEKQIKDTRDFLKALVVTMGIDPSKIAVIKNRVEPRNPRLREFQELVDVANQYGVRVLTNPIYENKVFQDASKTGMTLQCLAAEDEKAWINKGIATEDKEEKAQLAKFVTMIRGAKRAMENLDAVYAELAL